jgi:DNA polymerase (family 10)
MAEVYRSGNDGAAVTNRDIADALRHVYQLMQLAGENRFRAIAFDRAAQAVEGLEQSAAELVESGELTSVKGIGKSIAEDVRQFVQEGGMRVAVELQERIPGGLMEWLNVSGLGPKGIVKIHQALGISEMSELKEACRDGRVAGLPGMGVKSAEKILRSVEFLEKHGERCRLDEAVAVAEPMLAFLRKQSGVVRCELAGSLRRAGETIGDVDFLCSAEKQNSGAVLDAFVGHASVVEVLGRGETKSSVRTESGRQLDLRVVSPDEFGAALLYFTGSKNHNIVLRQRARERGMTLNEYGLFRLDPSEKNEGNIETHPDLLVASRAEEEIYDALDLHYIPPELREDHGRILLFEKLKSVGAAANDENTTAISPAANDKRTTTSTPFAHKDAAGTGAGTEAGTGSGTDTSTNTDTSAGTAQASSPSDASSLINPNPTNGISPLLETSDIRGVVHAHSTWSDGTYSIEEMALACMERGYEYLVMTDHSQTAAYAGGLSLDRVKAQWDEIDALNERLAVGDRPFRIFKGIESDILSDGALDYPDAILEQFDLVIGSVHSGLDMPLEKMMMRFEAAIRHPLCKMIGHPTGRLLLKRDESKVDMDRLIELAAEHGTAIEINASPWRLDMDWRHGMKARAAGLLTSVNPDAHSTDGIDVIPFGVMIGRKALFEKERVVNTLSAEEFALWLAG